MKTRAIGVVGPGPGWRHEQPSFPLPSSSVPASTLASGTPASGVGTTVESLVAETSMVAVGQLCREMLR